MNRQFQQLTVRTHFAHQNHISRQSSTQRKDPSFIQTPFTPRNNKKILLTAINNNLGVKLDPYAKLLETHKQLNDLVDNLDSKVANLVIRHQAEFLNAYRVTMKKVKEQLQQIREKYDYQAHIGGAQKIEKLQKQLILIRQQSFKLFQKNQQKQLEISLLKLKLQQSNSQKQHLQRQIKRLLKNIKHRQIDHLLTKKSIIIEQNQITPPKFRQKHSITPSYQKPKTFQSSQHNVTTPESEILISNLIQKLKQFIQQEDNIKKICDIFTGYLNQKQKKYQNLKKKYEKCLKTSLNNNIKSDLQKFFCDCIQVVRKEIYRKGQKQSSLKYGQNEIDLNLFKKNDQFKILEQFVNNKTVNRIILDIMLNRSQINNVRFVNPIKNQSNISTIIT